MASLKLTEAQVQARELLSQACRALDKATTGDIVAADEAFKLAITAAAAGREALKPTTGPVVSPAEQVGEGLRAAGVSS